LVDNISYWSFAEFNLISYVSFKNIVLSVIDWSHLLYSCLFVTLSSIVLLPSSPLFLKKIKSYLFGSGPIGSELNGDYYSAIFKLSL